jgi:hypothetical protein
VISGKAKNNEMERIHVDSLLFVFTHNGISLICELHPTADVMNED